MLEWAKGETWRQFVTDATMIAIAGEVITHSIQKTGARIIRVVDKLQGWLRNLRQAKPGCPVRRVICTGTQTEDVLSFCNIAGINVKSREKGNTSRHRFYLNEKHYCFFFGLGNREYVGWYGQDKNVITALKNDFEREWDTIVSNGGAS